MSWNVLDFDDNRDLLARKLKATRKAAEKSMLGPKATFRMNYLVNTTS